MRGDAMVTVALQFDDLGPTKKGGIAAALFLFPG